MIKDKKEDNKGDGEIDDKGDVERRMLIIKEKRIRGGC